MSNIIDNAEENDENKIILSHRFPEYNGIIIM